MTTPWVSRSHFLAIAAAATRTAVSRAEPSAAAMVANAVLLPVGVVGMAGAERVDQISVVFTPGIFIADQQRDRCAGGLTFKDAGQDFDRVGFLPLRDVAGRAGFAPIEILLDSSEDSARPGGQPSTTQPMAGPWLSPKDVTVKSRPKVLPAMTLLHEVELDA